MKLLRRPAALGTILALCLGTFTLSAAPPATAEYNSVGSTPLMGWSSWSFIRKTPTAAKIEAQADAMKNSGLAAVGYNYVNLDDFWYQCPGSQGPGVDANGFWATDTTKFPTGANGENGIAVVADHVHADGLKFGLYVTPGVSHQAVAANPLIAGTTAHVADIATTTAEINYNCSFKNGGMVGIDYTKPGAQQFIDNWAKQWASWGVDYVKIDGVGTWDVPDIQAWSTALNQTGRPIHLELSNELSINSAATWQQLANGWRTSGDIECYGCETGGSSYPLTNWATAASRFAQVGAWQPFGGPGGFNDYDSIEVGNGANDGLTPAERQSQLSLWALAGAPLTLGTDLTNLDPTDLGYLKNTAVIAVDQDAINATEIVSTGSQRVYAKVEPGGAVIVGLFNADGANSQQVSVNLGALGIGGTATGTDLWTGGSVGTLSGTYSTTLGAGASQLLRLTPNTPASFATYQAESSTNTLSGQATAANCTLCSGGAKVGYIGGTGTNNGTLTFNSVNVPTAGTYPMTISYAEGGTANRSATITVNGTAVTTPSFTPTGDYNTAGTMTVNLALRSGNNTIGFSNPSAYAPDIDSLVVPSAPTKYEAESATNTLGGTAAVASCPACSGGAKVGWVGSGNGASGTLTFTKVGVPSAGTYPVTIAYSDGTSGTTGRSATITVNGTVVTTYTFAPTGGWTTPGTVSIPLALQAGNNTIELSNSSAYAPDFDALTVTP